MSLIASSVPGLLGGVSQQPTSVRFPNQCEASDNALAAVVDGLIKRPPLEHVKKVVDGDPGLAKIHTIDRGVGERYAVILRDEDVKVFDLTDGTEIEVYDSDNNVADAADFAYLDTTDPVNDFRAVTVADYTFVLNSTKETALASATHDAAAERAFLFLQQSAYEVDYTADFKSSADSSGEQASLTTWDGTSSGNLVQKVKLQVTNEDDGAWTLSVLDTEVTYTSSSTTENVIMDELAALIRNINGVGSVTEYGLTNPGIGYIHINGEYTGLDLRVSLNAAPWSGSWTTTVVQAHTGDEEESVKTDVLAGSLAALINAKTNWTAVSSGSTIKMEPSSGTIESIAVSDSVGSSYLKRIYEDVDSITDLPLICQDGHVIKVNGDQSSNQDDYYLKFTADESGEFTTGKWEEAAQPGSYKGLDGATMPHTLIRKIDDGSGTVTGTAYAKYFQWAPFTWTDRVAGDSDTNPSPSFVGKTIRGMFLHQNRLGLLSDQNMIMSEVGLYGNFWRTTVLTLVDSDPIDIGVGHNRVSLLNHAVPFNQRLYLFSDRTQFVVNQSPMTPSNTTIVTTAEYENSPSVGGVSMGSSIYFPFKTEGYGRVLELYPTGETPTSVEVLDSTKHIPRYMAGEIRTLSGSTTESMLVATSSNRPNVLYVLSYFEQGKKRVQSAWQRFVVGGDCEILSAEFIEENLYLLIKRTEGLFLETVTFGSGLVDTDSDFRVTLDRRIKDTDLAGISYSEADHQTTITLPYNLDTIETYQVVTRAVNGKTDAFNLLSNTEDFGSWTASGATVTTNSTVAPDGLTTADTVTTTGDATHYVKQEVAQTPSIGDYYTWSFYIKKDLSTVTAKCVLDLYNVGNSDIIEQMTFVIDTSSGTLTLSTSVSQGPLGSYSTESLNVTLEGDWWRVSGTLKYFATDPSGDAVTGTRIAIHPASSGTANSVILWGAQLLKNNLVEKYNREAGTVIGQASTGSNTIVLNGDVTTTPLWIGEQYLMQYQFSEINLKESSATRRGAGVVADGQYYLRHGTIMFDNTGYFRIIVKPKYRDATTHPFTTTVLGGTIGLQDGKERFAAAGQAEDLTVYIENDSPLPSNILGVEWTALYNSKSARYSI